MFFRTGTLHWLLWAYLDLHLSLNTLFPDIPPKSFLSLNIRNSYSSYSCTIKSNTFFLFKIKNLVWHSHNFLLPYTAVEGYFIISFTFIFNFYFLCFPVDKLPAFIVIVNNFRILLECGCIHLIRTTKWFILYPK